MTANTTQLTAALLALVLLTFVVGARLLFTRVEEMRRKRIHPQAASNSLQMAGRLENVQAADNFKNLFEVPVLFYALAAVALATHQTPGWLVMGAWAFVALRVVHSFIHCTYNKVRTGWPRSCPASHCWWRCGSRSSCRFPLRRRPDYVQR